MLLPMLNNTSTSSNMLNISLLRSCTIDCFAGAKVIKKVESEKREVKSEVYSARDLFCGIDGTNGIDEGAERVSLENLRNLRSLARRYRHLLQSLTANLVPKFPKFPSLPSSVSAPIYPIKRAERVLKCQKGLFFLPFGLLSLEINFLLEGVRLGLSQKKIPSG